MGLTIYYRFGLYIKRCKFLHFSWTPKESYVCRKSLCFYKHATPAGSNSSYAEIYPSVAKGLSQAMPIRSIIGTKKKCAYFRFIYFICSVLFFISCTEKNPERHFPQQSEISGIASIITLQQGQTIILLDDFFNDVNKIDSVSVKFLSSELTENKKILTLDDNGKNIPGLIELKIWIQNFPYSLLLKKSGKITTAFAPQLFSISSSLMNDNGSIFIGVAPKSKKLSFSGIINSDTSTTDETTYFVFWENFLLDENFVSQSDNTRASNEKKLEIKIPDEAKNRSRSFIRVYASNKYGTSNDLLIPLQNGEVVKNASSLIRSDLEAMILYFLMPDRFSDGDVSNNHPVKDKEVDFKANYQGGDLKGITKKIQENYFSDLGVNTIWVSPIVQNPLIAYREFPAPHRKYSGYHGYWPVSSSQIDFRFGNDEDFKNLVDEAHKKNMNVLLDFVSNHIHQEHPLFKSHPDWFTKIDLPDGRKNIRLWDEHRLTTWFDTFLPDIDYSKQEVVDAMTDSALYWIKKFNLDGFRHDATKHVPEEFWRALTKKLKKQNTLSPSIVSNNVEGAHFFQIGETFGSRELIGSYVNSGEQDAQFDFNLYFDARSVFAEENQSFEKLNNSLMASFDYYGNHSLMGNITGNHDLPRFISLASGELKFNEDDKAAGWSREIKNENVIGYKKLSSLIAFMMTIPGVPVIYYGDEIGMAGAGDPDNRRMMKFDHLTPDETNEKNTVKKLSQIRKENLSLIYGDFELLNVKDNFYAYARTYFDEITIVAFNKSAEPIKIEFEIPTRFTDVTLTGNFGAKWSLTKNIHTLELKENSFEILTK